MILDYAEVATIVPVMPKVRHLEVAGATVHEHSETGEGVQDSSSVRSADATEKTLQRTLMKNEGLE